MLSGSATVITPPHPYLHEDAIMRFRLVALFLCEVTVLMTESCNVIGLHSIVQRHKL